MRSGREFNHGFSIVFSSTGLPYTFLDRASVSNPVVEARAEEEAQKAEEIQREEDEAEATGSY